MSSSSPSSKRPEDGGISPPGDDHAALASPMLTPQAVVDAGGESGTRLSQAMARRLHDISPGQVLQVVSLVPAARREVPEWCREHGHSLAATRQEGSETWFWITKCGPIDERPASDDMRPSGRDSDSPQS
jgi:TusA-related sulfurtransferase